MDHLAALLAIRARLLTTVVAQTGVVTLTATGNGFTRENGSFVNENFRAGMEVVPAGFADNTPVIISSVTDLEIRTTTPRTAQTAAPGRSLTVGIPLLRSWENKRIANIPDNRWYIDEDYLPGPSRKIGGARGPVEHFPMYVVKLNCLAGYGVSAPYTVAQAILDVFPPWLDISMPDGRPLRVQGDPAPFRGQLLPSADAGRAEIVITIPLLKRTLNPI